jgi:type I restriction enzyme M protein
MPPLRKKITEQKSPKTIADSRSLSAFVKSICDIMRRSNCASALQYVPELTWILFLRILDQQENRGQDAADAVGKPFTPALPSPYRWQDWAAPFKDDPGHATTSDGKPYGWKRQELFSKGDGKLFDFINNQLLPYLHSLDIDPKTKLPNPAASRKQRIIGRIMTAVERVRVDSETNFRDILDKVDEISIDHVDDTHFFTLSQVYEDLLLKMGEKNSDGGQFFTPREIIRAMVQTISPQLGEKVYDPCCGTGGFLAVAYEHIARNLGNSPASTDIETLKHDTFFGREKENLVFPIALANLVLHGIDQPNLWHGNTLTKRATYSALFDKAPKAFDVILTNPPFGGKEGKDAQKNYAFPTSSTQVLFVQEIIDSLAPEGRCAMVLDDGFLFRKEDAFADTKRKLVDECDLWAVISLPGGVFDTAGAGVKTNLLFFTKGKKTTKIWYYDLTHVSVGKTSPLTLAHFGFARNGEALGDTDLPGSLTEQWREEEANKGKLFPTYARLLAHRGTKRGESRYSWTVEFAARRKQANTDMQPHLAEADRAREEVVSLKEKLKALKKRGSATPEDVEALDEQIKAQEKRAREAQAKADAIGTAVFDLKAVNPNAVIKVDTRTPAEVIRSIEHQGSIVADCLHKLRHLLNGGDVSTTNGEHQASSAKPGTAIR